MDYIEEYSIAGSTYGIEDTHNKPDYPGGSETGRYRCRMNGCAIDNGYEDILLARSHLQAYAVDGIREELTRMKDQSLKCTFALQDLTTGNLESFLVVHKKSKKKRQGPPTGYRINK